ncbi:MAG: hypothetical protein A2086_17205 [Spirochaetes bacterium GWD1_27_9]|nr:MAG: hypothetical protein A2Z98_18760 [Spirochaetes bacterium GWB1_27_13]OHD27401.1 MAG: hypothetical protein A2Y34_12995 [Spirochaetes bacterium GWC1_27_15]OHD34184.1 MAG: hypothetical protein A2086_17205 [Spirochaetes bacterium GWD1_27_9]
MAKIIAITNNQIKIENIGGKAYNLFKLKQNGFNVPDFICLGKDFFKEIVYQNKSINDILNQNIDNLTKSAKIKEEVEKLTIPQKYNNILSKNWKKISNNGKISLAVRSSALDEDGQNHSFAGLMDSYLNVNGYQNLKKSIIKCFASIFNERAVKYREQNKLNVFDIAISVVIQQMVFADVSGVIFTKNVLNNNKNEIIISGTYGLGEGLVSGQVEADTYILNKDGKIIEEKISDKKEIILKDIEGTRLTNLDENLSNKSCINLLNLEKLVKISLKIVKKFGYQADIEYSIKNDKIYILQTRPITTLSKKNYLVWDNSNIVESYSGVTTPLTFTFIKKAYASVYKQFCTLMGIEKNALSDSSDIFNNMLGLIEGRVYYNLINWYKLVSFLPGYKYNKNFMEQMMGVSVVKDYVDIDENTSFFKKYFIYLPQTIFVSLRMIYILLNMKKRINIFFKRFYLHYNNYLKIDFDKMTTNELMDVVSDLEKNILMRWKEPILNDLKCMIFYGILKKLTVKWGIDTAGIIQNDLLVGEGGIKSKDVVTKLIYIAEKIQNNDKLKQFILNNNQNDTYNEIMNNIEFNEIKNDITQYLKDYGVRSIEEMKLESVPVKDNPLFCINIIKNYISNSVGQNSKNTANESKIRENAENKVKKTLKGKKSLLFIPKTAIYKWVLHNTREGIKDRENQRFCRTEIYGIVRDILKAIGKKWCQKNELNTHEDIFYLEWNEIWDFIKGTSTTPDLKSLVKLRKELYSQFKTKNPPDHIETQGETYIFLKTLNYENIDKETILKGNSCCGGIIENKVIILDKPDSNIKLNKEILVARQTDPGWVVLFPSISGLIIEKGSILSHSAIVAREMGIPTIVGVKNATNILKSGDRVRLDGDNGKVEII